MPLVPFYTRFRELAFRETRTVMVPSHPTLPRGPWGFLELYCDEAGCDCRRVLFQVAREDNPSRVWATINFGWESRAFYRRWSRDPVAAKEMSGSSLDPFNPQSEHSRALHELFRSALQSDTEYVKRLERHYRMFKGYSDSGETARQGKRGR